MVAEAANAAVQMRRSSFVAHSRLPALLQETAAPPRPCRGASIVLRA